MGLDGCSISASKAMWCRRLYEENESLSTCMCGFQVNRESVGSSERL